MLAMGGQSLNSKLAPLVTIADANERRAEWLHRDNAGQLAEQICGLVAGRFLESNGYVLALDNVPLEIEHLANAIAKTIWHYENAGGQGQACDSEKSLSGFAFDISNGDSKGVRKEFSDAGSFHQRRAVIGWRFRAHRFGRRPPGRAANGAKHTESGGASRYQQGQWECGVIEPKGQFGEAKEFVVKQHQLMCQQNARGRPHDRACGNHHKGKFQIMKNDLVISETEGFQNCDLFAL